MNAFAAVAEGFRRWTRIKRTVSHGTEPLGIALVVIISLLHYHLVDILAFAVV